MKDKKKTKPMTDDVHTYPHDIVLYNYGPDKFII
jgi:hypothetical protein